MINDIAQKNWVIEIRWPADMLVLGLIRDTISNIFRELKMNEKDIDKIVISIDEACTNVIKHAYEDYPHHPQNIEMIIYISSDHVRIDVIDKGWGKEKNGPHTGYDNLEEYDEQDTSNVDRPHGLGIHIIRKCMDEVDLSYPDENGTRLSMIKYYKDSQIA